MAKFYYNDVLLPEIPTDLPTDLPEGYPTEYSCNLIVGINGGYYLFRSTDRWVFLDDKIYSSRMVSDIIEAITGEYITLTYAFNAETEAWEYDSASSMSSFNSGLSCNPVWTNMDILTEDPDDNSKVITYLAASDPVPEGESTGPKNFYYNGVLLPPFPGDSVEDYPYRTVICDESNGSRMYLCMLANRKLVKYDDNGVVTVIWACGSSNLTITLKAYYLTSVDDGWLTYGGYTDIPQFSYPFSEKMYAIWSNYDIIDIDSKSTDSNMDYTVFLPASEPISPDTEYFKISKSCMTAIADAVREQTGAADTMLISEIIEGIESIVIKN